MKARLACLGHAMFSSKGSKGLSFGRVVLKLHPTCFYFHFIYPFQFQFMLGSILGSENLNLNLTC